MTLLTTLSPLSEFTQMILQYFKDIWGFLLFIGASASRIVVLVGAILMFVGVKVGKITGPKLILGGIILSIVVVFFALSPPDFILG
ncbi:MAG: hypothetical protein P1Q69_03970 [Candidatus Thorarchaeota archaeon]|nr:hypothetical protein [Candidatus Thorarchaeota archaeon]